jgi:hypothetical protein
MKIFLQLFLYLFVFTIISTSCLYAQIGELRWIRIGNLHQYFAEQGTDFEGGRSSRTYDTPADGMIWPGDYGEIQQSNCAHGFWVGAKNVYHPVEDKTYPVRVVGRGPRDHTGWQYELFPVEHRMIARFERPQVLVNNASASDLDEWDQVDEIDPNIPCDRLIITRFNTIIGLTVIKKIYALSYAPHDNYFIYEYILKNTGIYDANGNVYAQTLNELYMHSHFRYAFSGESCSGYDEGWGEWETTWGRNTINHVIFTDPDNTSIPFRAFYSWYAPESVRGSWDYGNPNNEADLNDNILDEHCAAAKYAGAITLHADTSPSDSTDDLEQPRTTNFLDSDADITQAVNAYSEPRMAARYAHMTSGHPAQTQWEMMYAEQGPGVVYGDVGTPAGGYAQTLGYGPYTLQPGDSVRIVIAEGVNGLSREKNREVTRNWLMYFLSQGSPTIKLPDGSDAPSADEYLKAWVETCKDSILKTLRAAKETYDNNFVIPQAPPPPSYFFVNGGGDRISLEWDGNAGNFSDQGYVFDGYEVWRAENNINNPQTRYHKIFSCTAADAVTSYGDTSVIGNDYYYYYLVSKARNNAGNVLKSSRFYTITNTPAVLLRPAGKALADIRVVPNPYVISQKDAQFSNDDEIRFYNIPAYCKIKVYTERGDLVWEKDHKDTSGKETWQSLTLYGQMITSGIYIAYFEVTQDYVHPDVGDGTQVVYTKGENTYRKFIVIR